MDNLKEVPKNIRINCSVVTNYTKKLLSEAIHIIIFHKVLLLYKKTSEKGRPQRMGHCMLDLSTMLRVQNYYLLYSFHALKTSEKRTTSLQWTKQLIELSPKYHFSEVLLKSIYSWFAVIAKKKHNKFPLTMKAPGVLMPRCTVTVL